MQTKLQSNHHHQQTNNQKSDINDHFYSDGKTLPKISDSTLHTEILHVLVSEIDHRKCCPVRPSLRPGVNHQYQSSETTSHQSCFLCCRKKIHFRDRFVIRPLRTMLCDWWKQSHVVQQNCMYF